MSSWVVENRPLASWLLFALACAVFSEHPCTGNFLDSVFGGSDENQQQEPVSEQDGMGYLNRFGYFSPEQLHTAQSGGASATERLERDRVRDALERFQIFAGLPKTGVMDVKTRKKMAQPRCGVRDEDVVHALTAGYGHRSAPQTPRWPQSKQYLTYLIRRHSRQIKIAHQREAIRRAFQEWAQHIPLDFSERASAYGSADIQIEFARESHGDPWPFDGRGGVLAHATLPTHGTLHFDEDERWKYYFPAQQISPTSTYTDIYKVALHEIGHVLGLSHSNDYQSIMAPFYQDTRDSNGRYRLPQLATSDIRSIKGIYGARSGRYHTGMHHRTRQRWRPWNQRVAPEDDDNEAAEDEEGDEEQPVNDDYSSSAEMDRRRTIAPEQAEAEGDDDASSSASLNSERIWKANNGQRRRSNNDDRLRGHHNNDWISNAAPIKAISAANVTIVKLLAISSIAILTSLLFSPAERHAIFG